MKKLAIIGSGSAAYTAGIYAGRAGLEPDIYQGHEPGGLLTTTFQVDNFPGFPDGVNGSELMSNMEQQAVKFNSKLIYNKVNELHYNDDNTFTLITDNGDRENYYSVILATGSTPKKLGIPGELEFTSKGVSTCATCDGFFYKGKNVIVVGGGDAAVEEAIFLTRFANTVTLIHRNENFKAQKILLEEARSNPKITIVTNTILQEILGDNTVTNVITINVINNNVNSMNIDGVFISIGHLPNSDLVKDLLPLDIDGYVECYNCVSHAPGLFVAGDVSDKMFRQAITAAGSGCQAAIMADRYLSSM